MLKTISLIMKYLMRAFCDITTSNCNYIYYYNSIPTYTLLNNTLQAELTAIYEKALSYQDQTNISQTNDDLPFVINASACYDLNKLVERVATIEE